MLLYKWLLILTSHFCLKNISKLRAEQSGKGMKKGLHLLNEAFAYVLWYIIYMMKNKD
jgi:hypothetical protein